MDPRAKTNDVKKLCETTTATTTATAQGPTATTTATAQGPTATNMATAQGPTATTMATAPTFLQRWNPQLPELLPIERMEFHEQPRDINPSEPEAQDMWPYDFEMSQHTFVPSNPTVLTSVQLPPELPDQPPVEPPIQILGRMPVYESTQLPVYPPAQSPLPDVCFCTHWTPGSVCTTRVYESNECCAEPNPKTQHYEREDDDYDTTDY